MVEGFDGSSPHRSPLARPLVLGPAWSPHKAWLCRLWQVGLQPEISSLQCSLLVQSSPGHSLFPVTFNEGRWAMQSVKSSCLQGSPLLCSQHVCPEIPASSRHSLGGWRGNCLVGALPTPCHPCLWGNCSLLPLSQGACATSTLMSVPATPATMGAHARTASTASPACAPRASTTPSASLK